MAINTGTSLSSTGTGTLTKNGPGTVVMTSVGTYAAQTYLNGGSFVITNDNGLGAVATGAQLNLNGGTLLGNATFTLDNAGANIRPVVLGNNGGGLAAAAGNTMTIDGVISANTGTGPLTIGIPASSANGNTVGWCPARARARRTPTAVNATGTVALTAANTYTGNTIISSGTLQLGAAGFILSTNIIVGGGATYDVSLVSGYAWALVTT